MEFSEIQNSFIAFHEHRKSFRDKDLNGLLVIAERKTERSLNFLDLALDHGTEDFSYEATSYKMLRHLFRELNLSQESSFYDLGAGFGKAIIYGGLTGPARYTGIEIVEERVHAGNRMIQMLGLERSHLHAGNILDHSLENGDAFFIFNSFYQKTEREVCARLRRVALHKPIRIAVLADSYDSFADQKWLRKKSVSKILQTGCPIEIYESL